ncbi:cardiomyopathy-associated protein 5-like, partial [Clarias magur]
MMDPVFSMVTLQSEDSGIQWEAASSRCSTPWASEISSPAPEIHNSLVPRHSASPGTETAGKIIFVLDEDSMTKSKKRKRNKAPEKLPMITDKVPREPDRPAMVEVSVPNVRDEKENVDKGKDSKEARKQRLFCLVSEGSEILNIVVPPKVSTVDEEESKGMVDNLSYLKENPVIKTTLIPEEPETFEERENPEPLQVPVQAIAKPLPLPPLLKPTHKQGTCEDYFEKFTLLDHQAPTGVPTINSIEEPETTTDQELYEGEDNAVDGKPAPEVSDDSASISGLEITSEHVDEVFYGGGQDPDFQKRRNGGNKGEEQPRTPLKKSGCDLFGSQESILTPIFLPEGPQKIIDLVLLEEPKAMAFMYSDLYADAVGNRKKPDDTESVTSEKSFHSQESDIEDRGYLEKFVLKDEIPVTQMDALHDDCKQDGVRMWSQDAFGLAKNNKDDTGMPEDVDEVTDFFRDSANSSPCEPIQLRQVEPEETKKETKTRRVVFKDEEMERTPEEDIDIAEAFLPLDISMDPLAMETSLKITDYKAVITEYAAKTCADTPSKSEKIKPSSKTKPPKDAFIPVHVPQTVKPIMPRHKPFLELTPLLPVEIPEEDKAKEREKSGEATQDGGQFIQQQARESDPILQQCLSTGTENTNSTGLATNPSNMDLYEAVEVDNETV